MGQHETEYVIGRKRVVIMGIDRIGIHLKVKRSHESMVVAWKNVVKQIWPSAVFLPFGELPEEQKALKERAR
jgi:hypothetical protein